MSDALRLAVLQGGFFLLLMFTVPLTIHDILLTIALWRRTSDRPMRADVLAFMALLLTATCFFIGSLPVLQIAREIKTLLIYIGLTAWLDALGLFGWSLRQKLHDQDDLDDVLAHDEVTP